VALASAAALLVLATAFIFVARKPPAGPPLREGAVAEIYSGTNFNALGVRRIDTRASFENGGTPLWADAPRFWVSLRWTGVLEVPKSGAYIFETRSKEGVRLLLDGAPLIANWGFHPPATDMKEVALEAGRHSLVLEYYHTTEEELLRLSWKPAGTATAIPITPGALRHDPASFVPREPPGPGENGSLLVVAGAQQGESLQVLDSSGDPIAIKRYESHRQFWRGSWGGDSHLWWGARVKPGDRLRLSFQNEEAGRRTLALAMTHASDHGVFKVRVNGVELAGALDLYDPDLRTIETEFKDVELKAGANELEFEVAGSNPQAREWGPGTGLYKLGLNHLLVR
jgi:hypothetical protein